MGRLSEGMAWHPVPLLLLLCPTPLAEPPAASAAAAEVACEASSGAALPSSCPRDLEGEEAEAIRMELLQGSPVQLMGRKEDDDTSHRVALELISQGTQSLLNVTAVDSAIKVADAAFHVGSAASVRISPTGDAQLVLGGIEAELGGLRSLRQQLEGEASVVRNREAELVLEAQQTLQTVQPAHRGPFGDIIDKIAGSPIVDKITGGAAAQAGQAAAEAVGKAMDLAMGSMSDQLQTFTDAVTEEITRLKAAASKGWPDFVSQLTTSVQSIVDAARKLNLDQVHTAANAIDPGGDGVAAGAKKLLDDSEEKLKGLEDSLDTLENRGKALNGSLPQDLTQIKELDSAIEEASRLVGEFRDSFKKAFTDFISAASARVKEILPKVPLPDSAESSVEKVQESIDKHKKTAEALVDKIFEVITAFLEGLSADLASFAPPSSEVHSRARAQEGGLGVVALAAWMAVVGA